MILFAGTGIQFIDIEGLEPRGNPANKPLAWQADAFIRSRTFSIQRDARGLFPEPVRDGGAAAAALPTADEGHGFTGVIAAPAPVVSAGPGPAAAAQQISVTPWQGFQLMENQWVPVPYNSTNPNWVRCMVHISPSGGEAWLTMACDTQLVLPMSDDGFSLLSNELGPSWALNLGDEGFWRQDYVIAMMGLLTDLSPLPSDALARKSPGYDRGLAVATTIARVRAALESIAAQLPQIEVLDAGHGRPIGTALVVDLGNCRTSAVLVEDSGTQARFVPLELRSLDRPWEKTVGVFDTHFEFVSPPFGRYTSLAPETPNFNFYSLIRLGKNARRAAELAANNWDPATAHGFSGMSSPKRYLWDDRLRPIPWVFSNPDERAVASSRGAPAVPLTIRGELLPHIYERSPFDPLPEGQPMSGPVVENPLFPRKTGLLFVLFELLNQAYSQMNSDAHRKSIGEGTYALRRLFQQLIIIYPSGMSCLEQEEFRKGAERAVALWHESIVDSCGFRDPASSKGPGLRLDPPTVSLECDEAMAVQMFYLFSELHSQYRGADEEFFRNLGRQEGDRTRLRLASLDIGGGTTDFVIADYDRPAGFVGAATIQVTRRFVDGISIGGDDVAKALLEAIVIPQVCARLGVPKELFGSLFSPTAAAIDAAQVAWRSARRQLVQHLWIPLVRRIWSAAEDGGLSGETRISDLLEIAPPRQLIEQLNSRLTVLAGNKVDILAVPLTVRRDEFDKVVRVVLFNVLRIYSDLISQFDCDLVLLAGRPSGLPAIQRIMVELCPVSPGRMIALQGHPVDPAWFPFASPQKKVEDAKFCAVVGATIRYAADHGLLGDFAFSEELAEQPTGNGPCERHRHQPSIFGLAKPMRQEIPRSQVLFTRGQSQDIGFAGENWICLRRIDSDQAPVNAMYTLRWSAAAVELIRRHNLRPRQVVVTVGQDPENPCKLTVQSTSGQLVNGTLVHPVTPAHVTMHLQTIFEDDYWLDTGCFG